MNTKTIKRRKNTDPWFFFTKSAEEKIVHLIIMLVMAFILIPLIWMVLGSLKDMVELFVHSLNLPRQFLWQNYIKAWKEGGIDRYILNSCLVTFGSLVPLLILASLAAYSFARFKFWGSKLFFLIILLGLMISPQIIVIPLSTILNRMKLINTHVGLILTYIAWSLPFSVFLLRAFFVNIPQEIIDSARIDGCSNFGAFLRIVMPIARPGLFSVSIFSGINIWNEFLFALIFLRQNSLKTIPVGLTALKGRYSSDYPVMLAGLTITVIPPLILFIIFNREFTKGLTAGSLKT